jgi:diguanylate cyclase (GGDEF)-like protein
MSVTTIRRGGRLSLPQWGMLAGVVGLMVALELVLVFTYVGLGNASSSYEDHGASATLLSNVQRETLKLALVTERSRSDLGSARLQRDILAQQLRVAASGASTPEAARSLTRLKAQLQRYDDRLAALRRAAASSRTGRRELRTTLDAMELEAKGAFDRAELDFYEAAGAALGDQKRSQVFLLSIGGVLFLLVIPLGFSLQRLFDSQLKRLSAFPRHSPLPVIELAPSEVTFANAAAESLAERLTGDRRAEAILPPNWAELAERQLSSPEVERISCEITVGDRILSWSFIAPGPLGTIHVYGEDVTEQKRAEETVRDQARLNGYQALHDSLTGLGNRRKLMDDAERKLELASPDAPIVLAIFDLDGFKVYNDTFGHPAGDALLARLGDRLRDALPGEATAYRMGGDEFCVLCDVVDVEQLLAVASDALSEYGESFSVTSSAGAATVPDEAETLVQALQLADQRLYANKRSRRTSAGSEARDALIQVLAEQDPRLASHMSNGAGLAAATARRLGLPEEDVARIRLAAELHDVGKTAIPDTILDKPEPLTDDEWAFMRRHTLIGERILAAAPALAGVAALVRSSHERIDGGGYPDGLGGDQIPLSARIVAIADAFDAMLAERPYRKALSVPDALDELRRCSGTQFDALVVAVFAEVVKEWQRPSIAA